MITILLALVVAYFVYNMYKFNKNKMIYAAAAGIGVFLFFPFIAGFIGDVFTPVVDTSDEI